MGVRRRRCKRPRAPHYTWADDRPRARSGGLGRRRRAPLAISDYGLIGDMRTAALVGLDGAIDWCCLPRFDSGSVFAAILDPERGGTWAVRPAVRVDLHPALPPAHQHPRDHLPDRRRRRRAHRLHAGGRGRPPVRPASRDPPPASAAPAGRVPMQMVFMPRFEYGARTTRLEQLRDGLFATDRTDQVLTLSSARPFEWTSSEQSAATTRFPLEKGEARWLVLRYDDDDIHPVDRYESARKLDITAAFWAALGGGRALQRAVTAAWSSARRWRSSCSPTRRSGAIIAAPTTSLPETIGGVRNWDYRFVWLRDAAFTLAALDAVGHRRGGRRVHAVPEEGLPPRGRRPPADHVRHRRTPRPGRAAARSSGGLPGLTAGPGRKRRRGPAPARRLRRGPGDGRHLAARPRDDRRHLARAARPGGLGEPELAPARLQHLGGAGRGAPLRLQQGDELGRARPRHPDGRGARRWIGDTAEWRVQRDALHAEILRAGLERAAPVVHSGLRRRRARRRGAGHSDGPVPSLEPSAGRMARSGPSRGSSPAPTASWCTATGTRTDWRARRGRSRSAPSGWPRR